METKEDFGFQEMQKMQKELQEKYKDIWEPVSPQTGRNKILWLMIELGEAADLIKKQGDPKILEDPQVRSHFVEELADVMMFFNDILLCYDISVEELATAYRKKHERNMERW